MKIEKPNWGKVCKNRSDYGLSDNQIMRLNKWFQEFVEPVNKMLEQGQWHYSYIDGDCLSWGKEKEHDSTHKALLINIQEIKPKTKEERALELLPKVIRELENLRKGYVELDCTPDIILSEAKAILEGE